MQTARSAVYDAPCPVQPLLTCRLFSPYHRVHEKGDLIDRTLGAKFGAKAAPPQMPNRLGLHEYAMYFVAQAAAAVPAEGGSSPTRGDGSLVQPWTSVDAWRGTVGEGGVRRHEEEVFRHGTLLARVVQVGGGRWGGARRRGKKARDQ